MGALDDIKSTLDLPQLAGMLGVGTDEADQAVDAALGSLLSTLGTKVDDAPEAIGLANALTDHVDSGLWGAGPVDLDRIDTVDGGKIVGHVYSSDQGQRLSGSSRDGLVDKLLPYLAPIVLSYLAKHLNEYLQEKMSPAGPAKPQAPAPAPAPSGGGILSDLLGQVLGGALGGAGQQRGPQPAPPSVPQAPAGDAPFRVPSTSRADGGLRIDIDQPTAAPQAPTRAPADNPIGSILKDILLGR